MALIKLSNNGVKNITSVGSIGTGDLVFISKQTASSSASISFTSGIDSTYKEYIFYFVNIHPSGETTTFEFNLSTDSGSNYNVTKTSTFFEAISPEDGSTPVLRYTTLGNADGLAQSANNQRLNQGTGAGDDECISGYLHLFNPSSTTFVKHYIANSNNYYSTNYSTNVHVGGYGNTTSAVDAVRFEFAGGTNIDSGDILLYGVN
jgi:hypothetical protein